MSFAWRIFAVNAAVFLAGTAILALSPVTVHSPITATEAIVLVAGLGLILAVNQALVWRSLAPLGRLTGLMRSVDLLRMDGRLDVEGPSEVRVLVSVFNDMLDRLVRERHESSHRAVHAQEEERRRVAQELHDEVGQSLTAVMLQLDRLAHRAPGELRSELSEAREETRRSLHDVRSIAQRLRPEVLDHLGLVAALTSLVNGFGDRAGLRVRHTVADDLPSLSPVGELAVYRVAQESLTNVARHSDATSVEVHLERSRTGVRLAVRDDGHGLDDAVPGAGIRGMRERALLVHGGLTIRSSSAGVEVRLEVPGDA
jgi:two-component system sensor histidine kinase UhpB